MKTIILFGIILINLLSGCSGSSGGTAGAPPAPIAPPVITIPQPPKEFNIVQSTFKIFNLAGQEISAVAINQSFKLKLNT